MKIAEIVLSDPKHGSEVSLGRLVNALAATFDFKQKGAEVRLYFHGTGTRLVGELMKEEHPAHGLYKVIKDKVVGVS